MTDLIADLRDRVYDEVVGALAGARRCALLDFPRHMNVGDSAIWAGERVLLARAGVEVIASTDKYSCAPEAIRHRLGGAPVLIHGGGNFGDLYLSHHQLRERIFADFADCPIIQLPQSINFQSAESLERTQRLIAGHGNVTIMTRDKPSFGFAREHFGAQVLFAPDAAFGLGHLARHPPEVPLVRQSRTDKEQAFDGAVTGETFDWLEVPWYSTARWEEKALDRLMDFAAQAARRPSERGVPLLLRAYDRYAGWNIRRGIEQLSRGEVVVTDRLHGHILCVLLGIRHVVLGDRFGKIQDFWEAWTSEHPLARFAQAPGDVEPLVASLSAA